MTTNAAGGSSSVVSLSDYTSIARRRWPSLVVGLLFGILSGAGWYQLADRSYEAKATVTINPITNELFSTTPASQLINVPTEAAIVQSIEVAERAADESGIAEDPRDLLERLTVAVPQQSLALDIAFEAETPERAAAGANAFARSYLDFRQERAEARRARYAEGLREELDELTEQFADAAEDGDERASLGQQIGVIRRELSNVAALTISPGDLVSEALPPRYATSPPRRLIAMAAGLVVGLIVGAGLAALRSRWDDRLFTATDVRGISPLPVVGTLPAVDRRFDLDPAGTEDVALTATQLARTGSDHGRRTWLAVRADPGRPTGVDVIAWWLGHSEDVLLVRLAAEEMSEAAALRATSESPGLQVRATPTTTSPAALDFRGTPSGYVLLDGGDLHGLAEAVRFADRVDVVLVSVELGVTRAAEFERTLEILRGSSPDEVEVRILLLDRPSWRSRTRSGERRRAGRAPQKPWSGTGHTVKPHEHSEKEAVVTVTNL